MQANDQLAKLRYHCRRGMLELDLVLLPFVDQVYPNLMPGEQELFTRLIECHDYQLFDWLIKGEQPEDQELKIIIQRIRQHAKPGN